MKLFLMVLSALMTTAAFAQNLTVSGNVTDASNGEPVPFASVHLQGTMTGVSTDADGHYSLSVPSDGILVFSSIGYKTLEVAVDSRTQIDVVMESDSQYLDETIVVAYGTATKSSFTGSAAVVNAETIENRISTNVTSALAGTTPGVQMISSSGDPASNGSSIRIRGIGSMSASSAPLYVVDGMPYDGSISDINPNDVESMSVLKDAAASAIYGARGANGVVLITTKRATTQDAVVKFDAKFGSNSRLIPQYDVIDDPAQYYELHYQRMYNSQIYAGKSVAEAYAFADKNLFDEANGGLGYQVFTIPEGEKFIGTNFKLNPKATLGYSDGEYYYTPDDWYNEAFHNSFRQEYNVSVSGAKDRLTYYGSVGYLNDGGIVNNSAYQRYTARINADYQAKKWMKISTSMSYSHSDSQTPSYDTGFGSSGNIFYITNNIGPIYPLYVRDAEGNIMTEDGRTVYDSNQTNFKRPNIVGNAIRDNEVDRQQNYADVLTGKWGIVITPVAGLNLTANVGLMNDNTRYNALYSQFGSSNSTDGMAYVSHSRYFAVNNQYLADYKTDFGGSDHNFDILAGFEMYRLKTQSLSGQNDHLFNPFIGELNNADGTSGRRTSSSTSQYVTQGFLARAQYSYAEKYFVSGSFRRDASSRFHKDHRWGNFGSAGVAWLISNEGFMSGASWVDMLKLKASYGVQGNDDLGSYYPYSDQYTHSYNEETGEYSLVLSYKGNDKLTWESSHSFNVGADFEFFGSRFNGTVEYFNRITSDLLYSKRVPLSAGNPTGRIPVNVGSISNAGFEASLEGVLVNTRNVRWDINANFSHYKNTILSLDESVAEDGIKGSNYIYEIGGSLYDAYMYKYAGVNKETGKAQYYKEVEAEDGTTTVEITEIFDEATQFRLGTVLPKLYGGFGTSLSFYGFDVTAQFSYQLGGKYYDGTYQSLMHTQASAGQAWHKDALKAWTPENTNTDVPRLDGDYTVAQSTLDRFLISSDYLSVNNVTIGYTFPKTWMSKINVSALRIYVSGENLAVLSARKGIDPRFSMGLGSYTSGSGLNSGNYSAMRTITGGITLTF